MACDWNPCQCTKSIDPASTLGAIPYPALIIDRDHTILTGNQAYLERYADRLPICGRKCFDVSHGLDSPCDENGEVCPLRACASTHRPVRALHVHQSPWGEERISVEVFPLFDRRGNMTALLETLKPLAVSTGGFSHQAMVGSAPKFLGAVEQLNRAAATDVSVLLMGESGTGKELMAESLHRMSSRRDASFVPIDCSALSPSLVESELLGHERGAFTGAATSKSGLVEMAKGGTLFLDEVGDVPIPLQVKLLRLLETRAYRHVGGTELLEGDFRLICATNRSLPDLVSKKAFRRDLYYRISVFPIVIPPLRERIEDLPLLLDHFRKHLGCNGNCRMNPDAFELLRSYDFPGNVRELRNIIERACLLSDCGSIATDHLPLEVVGFDEWSGVLPMSELQNQYLLWADERFGHNKARLAARLGISERTLFRKLRNARQGARTAAESGTRHGVDSA
ncbi:MAG: sigma-54 interaction domain-containing protein [Planctomycetota bacterium]|jgi:transcriptional regulator with PAS, ATPase and Fis domain